MFQCWLLSTDINECIMEGDNNCSVFADCSNTVGSYICTCQQGYVEQANGTICCKCILVLYVIEVSLIV